MTFDEMKMMIKTLMIEIQIEITDFVDSRNSDSRNFDLMHSLSSLMTDSPIHYSLAHMMNCCSSNEIFASMFDSMKPENNENLETTV